MVSLVACLVLFATLLFTEAQTTAPAATTTVPTTTTSPMPEVPCSAKDVCVHEPGKKCSIRTGFVSGSTLKGPLRSCAAPMTCLRDWTTEDEGVCVMDAVGMPCLMNNALGGCGTLAMAPSAYCLEGRCRRPPSFPGDHCWVDGECTSGAKCIAQKCVGIALGGLCTNQFRICDRGLYCTNAPPGHAKCKAQSKIGEPCTQEFSILGLLSGSLGVNECESGAHCSPKHRCISNDLVRAAKGESCTGRVMQGNPERLCKDEYYCFKGNHTCLEWPKQLWNPCHSGSDCAPGMVCNCKVGGVQVCEVAGEEGLAVYDFLHSASKEVLKCIRKHNCWQGQSSYPHNVFNEHSCSWINCRKHMSSEMHTKYCSAEALPEHRSCVVEQWCQNLIAWTKIETATPPAATAAPDQLVERLSPVEISAIVIGSLSLTLLVFFAGFIIGWVRSKFTAWRSGGSQPLTGDNDVEFSNLDSLVGATEEL